MPSKFVYLSMELLTKQFQIVTNNAVAAQLWTPSEIPTGARLIVISKNKISKALLY